MTELRTKLEAAEQAVHAADAAWANDLGDAAKKKAYRAAVRAFRAIEREALDAGVNVTCGRCDGTGVIEWARHVANGVCFNCAGAKVVALRKRKFDAAPDTRAKRAAAAAARWQAARDLLAGQHAEAKAAVEMIEGLEAAGKVIWKGWDEGGWVDGAGAIGAANARNALNTYVTDIKERVAKWGDADRYLPVAADKIARAAAAIGTGEKYRRMDARFKGTCVICQQAIAKGDPIAFDGQAAHDDCAVERYTDHGDLLGLADLAFAARQERAREDREDREAAEQAANEPEDIETIMARRDEADYQGGVATANRQRAEREVYGEMADAWHAQEDHDRYWRFGLDD